MNEQTYRDVCKRAYEDKKEAIQNYISKYEESNGKIPSEKLVKAFCKLRSIEYPLPSEEDYIKGMIEIWKGKE